MKRRHPQGFASLPVVSALALIFMLSLLMLLRAGMLDRDGMAKAQLRADYQQREEALLRALVAVFPQKAIASMKGGYALSDTYSWSTIFAQAQSMASVSSALSPALLTQLGLEGARNANGADTPLPLETTITSLSGVPGVVTPGTTEYAGVFADARFAGKIPPLLDMSVTLQQADAVRPVVSTSKIYNVQAPGLLADVTKYPLYNFIPYPNIRFGYATPGQPVVAKRNWWAFAVTFGTPNANGTKPVQALTKYYVLSLYELPSQLPIEAAAFAQIGTHQDGTDWDASLITISGGVYADQLALTDTFGSSRLAGKQSVSLSKTMTLNGTDVGNDFDQPGVRETLQAQSRSDALPVGLSANSGRLTFLPILRDTQFLQRAEDIPATNTWESYSSGGEKCAITVKATSMVSLADQTPTTIRVRFRLTNNTDTEVVLQRGVNWPTLLQAGGGLIPFQTELTDSNNSCITFYPTLLNSWLVSQGGKPVDSSNTIHFRTETATDPLTILPAANPPLPDTMAVIIRKGQDLNDFTNGLSIVSPLRVYVGDDLNITPAAAPPAGSALDPAALYYPPLSIFAGELRVGTTSAIRPFQLHGQVSTLASGGTGAWKPMDMKSGSDDAVHTDSIAAELKPLSSPADLPPVHQMNWLVVIEEIQQN
jgi:hypothetical protein